MTGVPESLVLDAVWCSEAFHGADCFVLMQIKPPLVNMERPA